MPEIAVVEKYLGLVLPVYPGKELLHEDGNVDGWEHPVDRDRDPPRADRIGVLDFPLALFDFPSLVLTNAVDVCANLAQRVNCYTANCSVCNSMIAYFSGIFDHPANVAMDLASVVGFRRGTDSVICTRSITSTVI
jgi:hypothetical protein